MVRGIALAGLLSAAVSMAHAVPGTSAETVTLDIGPATSAATFAPAPVTFGPVVTSTLLAQVLRDFAGASPGIVEMTPDSLLASSELDELRPLTVSAAALSTNALYEDPNRVLVIGGKRIEPLREEKRSLVKPLTFLFVGILVTTLFALFLPRLITGFTGGGPAQRKRSRR